MTVKNIWLFLVVVLTTSCSQNDTNTEVPKHTTDFIKSAHYFSSAWPKTFWQAFEEPDVAAELNQIKADGFNTIVLTVPWRGFELGFENEQTESNPWLYERLEFMLKSIVEQDLMFVLRVGFPHDYTPNTGTDGMAQCVGIYTDEKMQNHWLNYLNKVHQLVTPHQASSAGVLVSWEDFWCPHFVFPHLSDEERLEMAQAMNYGEWLKQQNQNIVKVLLQQNDLKHELVRVPKPADLSYVLYLEFIDYMLDKQVLQPAQSVFSNAALEIRVDKLPIKQGDHYTWIEHNLYLNETNHRGTYWAPFWGAENKGELLTAEQALKNFKYFLKIVSNKGQNTNHVIEQFNFYDNTPYFPNNANIKADEIDDFLLGAAPLLKEYSQGFGVWAYRDYQDNALLNSSFEMGTEGWQVEGSITVIDDNDDQSLSMTAGAAISQSMVAEERMLLVSTYTTLDLCLYAEVSSELEISLNGTLISSWPLQAGKNCTSMPAEPFKKTATTITLRAKTKAQIDELNLHGFTQELGLYDAYGQPAKNLAAYQALNALFHD
jgi:hypothetical protein